VVDGDEQTGVHAVGAHGALDQAGPRCSGGDETDRLVEADGNERLLDGLGEPQVEGVFGDTACTERARQFARVADVKDDAERRTLTVRQDRLGRSRAVPGAAHRIDRRQDHEKNERDRSGARKLAHDALRIAGFL